MKKTWIILCLIGSSINAQQDSLIYSFFTAGHVYGNPNIPSWGLHEPFVQYIPSLNADSSLELGFFTGDVVLSSTAQRWDSAVADLQLLNMPWHIAAGNHDMGSEFIQRFQNYYHYFIHKNDLFIILTPGLDNWNIRGDQLSFLISTLDDNYLNVENIFIFLHELIWWRPDNEYGHININYAPHFPGYTNYEDTIRPLLLAYPNEITLFAGDLGCTDQVSAFMYDKKDNITLIGSGMGGGIQDNIIHTRIYSDSIYHDLIALNHNDPNALGELYDANTTYYTHPHDPFKCHLYPNPAQEYIQLETPQSYIESSIKILNIFGQIIQEVKLNQNLTTIPIQHLSQGLYYLEFENIHTLPFIKN